VSLTENCNNTN